MSAYVLLRGRKGTLMRSRTALVIIDTQVGVMAETYGSAEILATINTLLTRARDSGAPVIYVQNNGPRGHVLEKGASGWEIDPAIAPHAGEIVVEKESHGPPICVRKVGSPAFSYCRCSYHVG